MGRFYLFKKYQWRPLESSFIANIGYWIASVAEALGHGSTSLSRLCIVNQKHLWTYLHSWACHRRQAVHLRLELVIRQAFHLIILGQGSPGFASTPPAFIKTKRRGKTHPNTSSVSSINTSARCWQINLIINAKWFANQYLPIDSLIVE